MHEECSLNSLQDLIDETGKGSVSVLSRKDANLIIGRAMGKMTYITGALMKNTAFHSARFIGRIENNVCKKGV